jgi:hypothetical protein
MWTVASGETTWRDPRAHGGRIAAARSCDPDVQRG